MVMMMMISELWKLYEFDLTGAADYQRLQNRK